MMVTRLQLLEGYMWMIINANALHIPIASGSVQTVVTSPPYYGLRDYGVHVQLGLEQTPEAYIANMVAVFREVRRVLRDDGTLWLNVGDSYAGGTRGGNSDFITGRGKDKSIIDRSKRKSTRWGGGNLPAADGLKPKDLIGIPWRLAFALQADGWYLRSDIIWSKPNPMPESVTDRPTKSHEYVFLLTKSARYYYDADAVREKSTSSGGGNFSSRYAEAQPDHGAMALERGDYSSGRNRRTVWTIATQPTKEAHFATFPEKLVEPCILAGTSERGCCPKCGKPWERVTEPDAARSAQLGNGYHDHSRDISQGMSQDKKMPQPQGGYVTVGWQPGCECFGRLVKKVWFDNANGNRMRREEITYEPQGEQPEPVPCVVLDPFAGSGTVERVAIRLRRRSIGTELNYHYISEIVPNRTADIQPVMFGGAD